MNILGKVCPIMSKVLPDYTSSDNKDGVWAVHCFKECAAFVERTSLHNNGATQECLMMRNKGE